MGWSELVGREAMVERFRRAASRGRLTGAYLLVGPPGVGKRTFARKLAQALLCETNGPRRLDPCGRCPGCRQAAAGAHPDLDVIVRPPDRAFIPLELLIGSREQRMREGLRRRLALKPRRGGCKVALIEDADYLNEEGANCLLKLLEEPPPRSVLILAATSEQGQLPTIRSRCQTVRFGPLPERVIVELLVREGLAESEREASEWARAAEGSAARARDMADPAWRTFRAEWLERLGRPAPLRTAAKDATGWIDAAGSEAAARRRRLIGLAGETCRFYHALLRRLGGAGPPTGDSGRGGAVEAAAAWWSAGLDAAARCVERCVDVEREVEANANQAALIDCWLDELDEMAAGRR